MKVRQLYGAGGSRTHGYSKRWERPRRNDGIIGSRSFHSFHSFSSFSTGNIDVLFIARLDDLPLASLLMNSLNAFMPCRNSVHAVLDKEAMASARAWLGIAEPQVRGHGTWATRNIISVFVPRAPPTLPQSPAVGTGEVDARDEFQSVDVRDDCRSFGRKRGLLGKKSTVALYAAQFTTARGFIVELQFLDSLPSFAMKVTEVSGGEFVMFFVLANEVTCRSLFDERGRLYQVAPLSSRACCSKCDFTVSD